MTNSEFETRIHRQESFLIASDGQFLGLLSSNRYMSESVLNEYGSFGSKYSSTSIFNEYSRYGGEYNDMSPFNRYTTTPPRIYLRGIFAGYLSLNLFLANRVDPYQLYNYIINNGL